MSINLIYVVEDKAEAQKGKEAEPRSQGESLATTNTALTGFIPHYWYIPSLNINLKGKVASTQCCFPKLSPALTIF